MRVLYDGQIFSLQPFGGVARYFSNLISSLPKEIIPLIIACRERGKPPLQPLHQNSKIFSFPRFGFRPGCLAFRVEQIYFRKVAVYSKADIIHPTYYYLLLGKNVEKLKKPIVVTLYDLLHEIFPREIDPKQYHARAKKEILKRAQHIICISERTRRDLIEYYPEFEHKASVVHLAPDQHMKSLASEQSLVNKPYFLFVGQRKSYKNFDLVVRAFSQFAKQIPNVDLLVAGPALSTSELAMFKNLGIEDRVKYFGLTSDSDLATLYRHSLALIYPSLYEGFGLPPLEAMLCQTAAICSSTSALQEVVGDAALIFDPYSDADLLRAMKEIFDCENKRLDLIKLGKIQVEKFNVERMMQETLEIYRGL